MLNSPIESLVFNYFSFEFFAIVNNCWTWVAVFTAAVSFWKIRAAAVPGVTSGYRESDPLPCDDGNGNGSLLVLDELPAAVSVGKIRAAGVISGYRKSDPSTCNDGNASGSSLVSAKELPAEVSLWKIRAAGVISGYRKSDPLPCNDGNTNGSALVSVYELPTADIGSAGVSSCGRKFDPPPCNDGKTNGSSPVLPKELPGVHRELITSADITSGCRKSDPPPSYTVTNSNGSLPNSEISPSETRRNPPATKGKCMVYYENESENHTTGEWEDAVGCDGGEWWEFWERVLMMKMGEMGWYRNQKLPAMNGNVVRFWDERDSPTCVGW